MCESDKINKIKTIKESYDLVDIPSYILKLAPKVKFESFVDNILSIKMPNIDLLPTLPAQYGFKGGAARLALGLALNYNFSFRRPRDIDIVRFGNKKLSKIDKELEKVFMKDDATHGHGIEILESIEKYFQTRDITINEILIINNTIYFTVACLTDLYNGILRPTEFVLDKFRQPDPKITMKMIRLQALASISGEEFTIAIDRYNPKVTGFHIALNLDRALSLNSRVAAEYIDECIEYEYLPDFLFGKSIGDVISYLAKEDPNILNLDNIQKILPKKSKKAKKLQKNNNQINNIRKFLL
ncbi:MAG: hypothetical protein ACOX3T_04745 [Bdellovibrionota bacterium]